MIPAFATAARFERSWPDFAWDEWDIEPCYADYDPAMLARLALLTGNANHALVCACGYWIAERFSRLDRSGEAVAFLDVASVSTYEAPRYEYFEIDEEDWHGPVRGPLALMITIAVDALYCLAEDPEPAIRVCYMYNLCRHVLTPDDGFLQWFESAVRLMERFNRFRQLPLAVPLPDADFGPPVPISAFDPAFPYTLESGAREFDLALRRLDPANPFLPGF